MAEVVVPNPELTKLLSILDGLAKKTANQGNEMPQQVDWNTLVQLGEETVVAAVSQHLESYTYAQLGETFEWIRTSLAEYNVPDEIPLRDLDPADLTDLVRKKAVYELLEKIEQLPGTIRGDLMEREREARYVTVYDEMKKDPRWAGITVVADILARTNPWREELSYDASTYDEPSRKKIDLLFSAQKLVEALGDPCTDLAVLKTKVVSIGRIFTGMRPEVFDSSTLG